MQLINETLKSRLKKVGQLEEIACDGNCTNQDIINMREGILFDFYYQNALSYFASIGWVDYRDEIIPILKKYSSLISKVVAPKKDDEFDKETRTLLDHINLVGESEIDPENFTTSSRSKELKSYDNYSLVLGIFGGSATTIAYNYFGIREYFEHSSMQPIISMISAFAPLFATSLFTGIGRLVNSIKLEIQLNYLIKSAEDTDSFLKENKLKEGPKFPIPL